MENITIYATKRHHHKISIYIEYRSVCHVVGNGTPPPPLPQASVPPNGTKGGGGGGEGGGVPIPTTGKKPSTLLYLLCIHQPPFLSPLHMEVSYPIKQLYHGTLHHLIAQKHNYWNIMIVE